MANAAAPAPLTRSATTGLGGSVLVSSARSKTSRILGEIFAVRVAKTARIDAPAFGITLRVSQLLILFGLIYSIVTQRQFAKPITASGTLLEAWMQKSVPSGSTYYSENYCTNPYSFDYWYCWPNDPEYEFWCEQDIQCRALDGGTMMYKQSTYDMWAVTYVKDRQARSVDCSGGAATCDSGEVFQVIAPGDSCQCVNTRNYFLAGAEHIEFVLRPQLRLGIDRAIINGGNVNTTIKVKQINQDVDATCPELVNTTFTTVPPCCVVSGLTNANSHLTPMQEWTADADPTLHCINPTVPDMCSRTENSDISSVQDCRDRTVGDSSKVRFTVNELLKWSGIDSLDDLNQLVTTSSDCSAARARSDGGTGCSGRASYRVTGITFDIDVHFSGTIGALHTVFGWPEPSAEIRVTPILGWHSVGDDMPLETGALTKTSTPTSDGEDTNGRIFRPLSVVRTGGTRPLCVSIVS